MIRSSITPRRKLLAVGVAAALLTVATLALTLRNRLPGAPLPTFAEVGIEVVVSDADVEARFPADGGQASAVLMGPAGETLATARLRPLDSEAGLGHSEGILVDSEGDPVAPMPGMRLVVTLDEVESAAEIPQLDVTVDRLAGRVEGSTLPGAAVSVELGSVRAIGAPEGSASPEGPAPLDVGQPESPPRREAKGSADDSGSFALIPSPSGPIAGRTPMTVTVSAPSGLRRTIARSAPYVRASLHPGDVSGTMNPYDDIQIELRDADEHLRATGRALADNAGRYTVWLRDDTGELLRPAAGDSIEVSDASDRLKTVIPVLASEYVEDDRRLKGDAAPGSTMSVFAWNPWSPGHMTPGTEVESTGRWTLDMDLGLQPASHYYLTETTISGDDVTICQQRPLVRLTPGSPALTASALWETEAALSLERSGEQVATVNGRVLGAGDLELLWKDASGNLVDAAVGDVVAGVVNGWPVHFTVAGLEAAIDPATATLAGTAPPGAEVYLGWGAPWETVPVGADGDFRFDLSDRLDDGALAPGKSIEVGYAVIEGHHIRRLFTGVSVSVSLTTGAITGMAPPNSPFEIQLFGSDGVAGATVNTVADAHGRVRTTLPAGAALPRSGSRLRLTAGTYATTIEIPSFTANFAADTGTLSGTAPPGELVVMSLYMGDSSNPEERHVFVDDDGTWTIDLRQPRLGQGYVDLDSVRSIDVFLEQDAHSIALSLEGTGQT